MLLGLTGAILVGASFLIGLLLSRFCAEEIDSFKAKIGKIPNYLFLISALLAGVLFCLSLEKSYFIDVCVALIFLGLAFGSLSSNAELKRSFKFAFTQAAIFWAMALGYLLLKNIFL